MSKLDSPHLHLLERVDFAPVFIMGDHRSGTTLLYQTLSNTGCFNFIKAYHIIKYDELLSHYVEHAQDKAIEDLEAVFKSREIQSRVIDRVEATPHLPEEYGFILSNKSNSFRIRPGNCRLFEELCRKVQLVSEPNRAILLKNPWDFVHFLEVKKLVPDARFIFLHRHPVSVINSKLKAIRSISSSFNPYISLISNKYDKVFRNPALSASLRAFYSKRLGLGLRRITSETAKAYNYFQKHVGYLNEEDYITLQYEGLCNEPDATIAGVLEFLEVTPQQEKSYQALIQPRPTRLLPEIERHYEGICKKLRPHLDYHGYNPSLESALRPS